jgi:hypothetical protein
MIDYEEQTLVAGVKNGQQCTICRVPSDQRENLDDRSHPLRDHGYMRNQIRKQRENPKNYPQTHEEWVQPWDNFAWEHDLVNIHEGMMIDKLHQLYKGIVKYTIQWVQEAVEDWSQQQENKDSAPKRWKKGAVRDITLCTYVEQLDHRFKQIPEYPGLKRFNNAAFSGVKQWSGNEQRAIVHQLGPVLAPILTKKHPQAMQFVRAMLDFVMLAEYRSHDEQTLECMDQALSRIDKLKEYFRDLRPKDKHTGEGQFNFPKFHILTHYTAFKKFGTLDGFDSATPETGHKGQVKEPYNRTNKRDDFLAQVTRHSLRRINWMAMEGILSHMNTKPQSEIEKRKYMQLNTLSGPRDLSGLKMSDLDQTRLESYVLKERRYWRPAATVASHLGYADFIDALAVFIREMRRIRDMRPLEDMDRMNSETKRCGISYIREAEPCWVNSYPVSLHSSMKCWIKTGKDPRDVQATTEQFVRCSERWQNKSKDRRDYVWVHEYRGDFEKSPTDGRTLGQLLAIITVRDIQRRNDHGQYQEYQGCFLATLKPKHNGQPNLIHGMLEYQAVPIQRAKKPRKLGGHRFYSASMVIRGAHVVPAGLVDSDLFLVNNYIDWGEYTEIYTLQSAAKTMEAAEKVAAEEREKRLDAGNVGRSQPQAPTRTRGVKTKGKRKRTRVK